MHLTAAVSPAELPSPEPPLDVETEKIASLPALWGSIEVVAAMPGSVPASYAQLGTTAAVAEELVGRPIWVKYHADRKINNDDVVPKHLLLRLSTQLTKLADAYAKAVENTLAAKTRLEEAFGTGDFYKGKGKGGKVHTLCNY